MLIRTPTSAIAVLAAVAAPLPLHVLQRSGHGKAAAHPAAHRVIRWHHAAVSRRHPRRIVIPLAHAAGDPSDTISDFQFSPATITVQVGDTITWTNNGPSPHTATADNHSFDTGILQKGQSGSHTFTTPGTYAYICTIHPFMHGTVVVLASTASNSSSSGTSGSSASGSTSGSSSSGTSTGSSGSTSSGTTASAGTLPRTGYDSARALAVAIVLLAAGLALRRRLSTRR